MMTDSIADMLTRIRNANRIESPSVDMPSTKVKVTIAQVLKDEGFVIDYQQRDPGNSLAAAGAILSAKAEPLPKVFQDALVFLDHHDYRVISSRNDTDLVRHGPVEVAVLGATG